MILGPRAQLGGVLVDARRQRRERDPLNGERVALMDTMRDEQAIPRIELRQLAALQLGPIDRVMTVVTPPRQGLATDNASSGSR
jgi:hypothetical protein